MVQRHDHDVTAPREILAIVGTQLLTGTGDESTTVQPYHDRPFGTRIEPGSPHVHAEAILALDAVVPQKHEGLFVVLPAATRRLRAYRAVVHRAAHPGPGR